LTEWRNDAYTLPAGNERHTEPETEPMTTTTADVLVNEIRVKWAGYLASRLPGFRQQVLDRLSALGVRSDWSRWTDEQLANYLRDHWRV
jgi:hypothetical protein